MPEAWGRGLDERALLLRSISDVLSGVELAEPAGVRLHLPARGVRLQGLPFQAMDALILRASFRLQKSDPAAILAAMQANRADREAKGHFLWPCAAASGRTNRSFGQPTGRILDSLAARVCGWGTRPCPTGTPTSS